MSTLIIRLAKEKAEAEKAKKKKPYKKRDTNGKFVKADEG